MPATSAKTEGVIPARNRPSSTTSTPTRSRAPVGDEVSKPWCSPREDRAPAHPLSEETRAVRACLGHHRGAQGRTEPSRHVISRPCRRVDPTSGRGSRPPAGGRCAGCATCSPAIDARDRGQDQSRTRIRNNVVLSCRAWLSRPSPRCSEFLNNLQKAPSEKGRRPRSSTSARLSIQGVDDLVHVSELSWKHIDHPSEVVQG